MITCCTFTLISSFVLFYFFSFVYNFRIINFYVNLIYSKVTVFSSPAGTVNTLNYPPPGGGGGGGGGGYEKLDF